MSDLSKNTALIIGWEYPPRMVGGLAIATHGIVKALSKYIKVILIIPFKDENTPKDPNITVYGLNTIEKDFPIEDFQILKSKLVRFKTQQFKSQQSYSVYPLIDSTSSTSSTTSKELTQVNHIHKRIDHLTFFASEEVYGFGLWDRMRAFKEVVGVMSQFLSFDIIHCHDWITFETGAHIKWLSKKPLALHVHALETDRVGTNARNENEIYNIEQNAMQLADVIFPVSEYTKKCIIDHYAINESKIVSVHNAIENISIKRWRHKTPQKIVAFVGRITSQKGPGFLLETIRKVVEGYKNVRFVIAGSGDLLEELMMSSAFNQLSRYIVFEGFIKQEKVHQLLATSDVYFMPSVSEPFGLTALEAAKAGVSCVVTKQSGAVEVLKTALNADFWDTDKFASHIIHLLQNDEERVQLVEKQNKEVKTISWNNSAKKVIENYKRILNK